MPVNAANHIPAIGLEALGSVIGKPAIGIAVDTDFVVIPERHQLVQPPGASQRSSFVTDAFHQAAITQEHPSAVVNNGMTITVEMLRQQFFCQRETDRIRNALPQGAGGCFHTRAHVVFRMAGSLAAQLTKLLQVINGNVITCQMQQRVLQHRTMSIGQHETVAVMPSGIGRVALQVIVPQHLGNICHAHRHARVTGVGGLHRINGKKTNSVGEFATGWLSHGRGKSGGNPYCPMLRGRPPPPRW